MELELFVDKQGPFNGGMILTFYTIRPTGSKSPDDNICRLAGSPEGRAIGEALVNSYNERDTLKAENIRRGEALEKISAFRTQTVPPLSDVFDAVLIATEALKGGSDLPEFCMSFDIEGVQVCTYPTQKEHGCCMCPFKNKESV